MKFSKLKYCIALLLFISICAFAQQNLQNKFRLGKSFEQAGEYERAKQIYKEVYNAQPNNIEYLTALNNIYLALREFDNSIKLLENRIEKNPNDVNSTALLGTTYYTKGDTSKAFQVWETGLLKNKNSMAGYRAIITAVIENRVFEKAIEYLEEAKNYDFDNPIFSLDLAYIYSITMNYEKAAQEYLAVIENDHNQMYNVLSRMNRYLNRPEAVDATIEAVEEYISSKTNPDFYEILINLYKLDKNYNKAFEYTQKLDEARDSKGGEIYQFAGEVLKEKRPSIAAEAYNFVVDNYPGSQLTAPAKIGYAKSQEQLLNVKIDSLRESWKPYTKKEIFFENELNELIEAYNSLLKNYKDKRLQEEIKFRIAGIYKNKLNELKKAKLIYSEIAKPDENNIYRIQSLLNIAEIEILEGNIETAEQLLKKIKGTGGITPEEKDRSKLLLGKLYFWKGSFDSSKKLLDEIIENLNTDDANDALQLQTLMSVMKNDSVNLSKFAEGDLYTFQNRFEEASTVFKSLAENENLILLNNIAKFRYAQILVAVNNYPAALTVLEEITSSEGLNLYKADAEFLRGEIYFFALQDYDNALSAYRNILENYGNSLYFDESREKINYINSIKKESI